MISLKKRNQGFTIVELLIVIVVIGILALLVITTYSGIQSKARNSKRSTDIGDIQTQLEAFYGENSYYPSLADLNSPSWRSDNMKSLDSAALVDPSNTTCDPTDAAKPCLVDAAAAKSYAYVVKDSSGNSCESKDTDCANYTLTATFEGTVNGKSTASKSNLD
ncbi:MAG TPA: prepilin-type N-terminal cleavage/methylation domain-containing protein [Candidatus Saccharimonadales bacterium]|nr:prepilin-type N-terminal cleavage/methylation domain-containing protein [Candidatus Saccharimonadales bacterium]